MASVKPVLFTLIAFAIVAFCVSSSIGEGQQGQAQKELGGTGGAGGGRVRRDAAAEEESIRVARGHAAQKQKGRGNVFNWNVDASHKGHGGKGKEDEEAE